MEGKSGWKEQGAGLALPIHFMTFAEGSDIGASVACR
jgi:hypothetical protein